MISNSYNRFTKGLIAIVLVAVMTYGFTSHAAGLANDYHAGEEVRIPKRPGRLNQIR